jgi:RNA polymerase sigma-70 factor (ECF subfamily)
VNPLDPHLFRHEWARLVAALVRVFGVHNLELAEDVAQETLFRAMNVWKQAGVPDHPSAWLTTVAKRRVIDELRRARKQAIAAPEVARFLESEWTRVGTVDELFAEQPWHDDELRVMFSLAQPRLPEASQLALVLQLSCGFSEAEIAAALMTSTAAVTKRLQRAKEVVRGSRSLYELADADLPERLASVQRAIYLLFNEGYHGASPEAVVRADLCAEALRLAGLLANHPRTGTTETLALAALLHLHAARLPARLDEHGEPVPFSEQPRDRWDESLISRGLALLGEASCGDTLTPFHIEAAIAAVHATAASTATTPWPQIVGLYDTLLRLAPSPIVGLNRAIAVAEAAGPERGLAELAALDARALESYVFYHAALGQLSARAGDRTAAELHFARAIQLARSPMEAAFLTHCAARFGADSSMPPR